MSDLKKGAANICRTRLQSMTEAKALLRALNTGAFQPIDPKGDDERSAGFVEFEDTNRSEFRTGSVFHREWALFTFRVDKLKVPTAEIRKGLLEWAQSFEQKNGRAPGRRERAEQKETIKKALRSTVTPVTKLTQVSIDDEARELFVWTSSRSVAEEVQGLIESLLDVQLVPRVPGAFMSTAAFDSLEPTVALFGEPQ